MEPLFFAALGVSVVCVVVLFVLGNRHVRLVLALCVLVLISGFVAFLAYASGFLASFAERFL